MYGISEGGEAESKGRGREREVDLDYVDSESTIIDDGTEETFCTRVKELAKNSAFLLICTSLTFMYFIITGIQFWVSDYLIGELKVK